MISRTQALRACRFWRLSHPMNAAQSAAYHGVIHRHVLFEDLMTACHFDGPGPRSGSTRCRFLPELGA